MKNRTIIVHKTQYYLKNDVIYGYIDKTRMYRVEKTIVTFVIKVISNLRPNARLWLDLRRQAGALFSGQDILSSFPPYFKKIFGVLSTYKIFRSYNVFLLLIIIWPLENISILFEIGDFLLVFKDVLRNVATFFFFETQEVKHFLNLSFLAWKLACVLLFKNGYFFALHFT